MKGREHPLDLLADGAVADQQHAFPSQLLKHDGRMKGPRIAGDRA